MLGGPALLMFASGASFFLNGYVDTIVRAVAVDASRYAALADQSYDGALAHLDAKIKQTLPKTKIARTISIGKTAKVELSYEAILNVFNIAKRTVTVQVETPIETY
jgi:hypothetical protein